MISVEEKLPEFWHLAQETAADLRTKRISDWDPLIQKVRPLLEPGLVASMDQTIPGWKNIATLHGGETALHTLLVFATCLNLPEYRQAEEQTRWELEWAAVLHDIDKQLARNDTAHPFRSAAAAAKMMPNLGFEPLPGISKTDLAAWSNLVRSALRPDCDRMLHDHAALKEIIAGLHTCWGDNRSAARVLKAVLLHQSLPTLEAWPSPVLLTDEELAYALTVKDMDVLGPLIVADSDSWNIFDDRRSAYLAEIRSNNAETRQRIKNLANQND